MAKKKTTTASVPDGPVVEDGVAPPTVPQHVITLKEAGIEVYEMVTILRSALADAPYNPRVLSDGERRRLAEGIKANGLVAPVTYNKRTGHIVGGHQRLTSIDSLMGTQNYELTVAQIDVDDVREKELNLLLNNPHAQGDWDLEKLGVLVADKSINVIAAGFEHADIFKLLGSGAIEARDDSSFNILADKLREAAAVYDAIAAGNADKDSAEFFLVLVFRDASDCTTFITEHNLPDERYQSGADIRRLLAAKVQTGLGAAVTDVREKGKAMEVEQP